MLLEEVSLPDNTVAPGTTVRFREVQGGRERTLAILGPWEADGETIVSYRAPLAAGMLGLQPGESGRLELPSGPLDVEILGVEPFDFSRLESPAS